MLFFNQDKKENTAEEVDELLQKGYRFALSLTHHSHDAEDLLDILFDDKALNELSFVDCIEGE